MWGWLSCENSMSAIFLVNSVIYCQIGVNWKGSRKVVVMLALRDGIIFWFCAKIVLFDPEDPASIDNSVQNFICLFLLTW